VYANHFIFLATFASALTRVKKIQLKDMQRQLSGGSQNNNYNQNQNQNKPGVTVHVTETPVKRPVQPMKAPRPPRSKVSQGISRLNLPKREAVGVALAAGAALGAGAMHYTTKLFNKLTENTRVKKDKEFCDIVAAMSDDDFNEYVTPAFEKYFSDHGQQWTNEQKKLVHAGLIQILIKSKWSLAKESILSLSFFDGIGELSTYEQYATSPKEQKLTAKMVSTLLPALRKIEKQLSSS